MTHEFVTQVATFDPGHTYYPGRTSLFNPGNYAQDRFPQMRGEALFTYCFRRFGYPSLGWDGRKDLVAYVVTTPEPEVFLHIRPYCGQGASVPWLSFGYMVKDTLYRAYERIRDQKGYRAWLSDPLYRSGKEALERAMDDLLRPVPLDDLRMTCLGVLDDEEESVLPEVEHYPMAGYGVPQVLFESEDAYDRLTARLEEKEEKKDV